MINHKREAFLMGIYYDLCEIDERSDRWTEVEFPAVNTTTTESADEESA